MPTLSEFFSKFGSTEIFISLFIICVIVGIRERKNIMKLFGYGKKEKKNNLHTEE